MDSKRPAISLHYSPANGDLARGFDFNADRVFIREPSRLVGRIGGWIFAALLLVPPIARLVSHEKIGGMHSASGTAGLIVGMGLCASVAFLCIDGAIGRTETDIDFTTGALRQRKFGVFGSTSTNARIRDFHCIRYDDGSVTLGYVGGRRSMTIFQHAPWRTQCRWARLIAARAGLPMENIELVETP